MPPRPPDDSSPRDQIFALSEVLIEELAALRPTWASLAGVAGHEQRWDDHSPEGIQALVAWLRDARSRIAALPPATERWGRLASDVMGDLVEIDLEGLEEGDAFLDLNGIASPFQLFRLAIDSMDRAGPSAGEDLVMRLAALPSALEGYRRCLEEGLRRGPGVAARQVKAALAQGRVLAGPASPFRELPLAFADRPQDARRITRTLPAACAAYGALSDWLEHHYLPRAPLQDAVGPGRYARALRRFLGARPDPQALLDWGWSELVRIQAQMHDLAREIDPSLPLPALLVRLRTDPAVCAPDAETFLAQMQALQARALAALDGPHFQIPPALRQLDVKRAPRGGKLGAYYMGPSEDFSRPGAVWYSLPETGPYPLYDQVSTAFHEGFPGHHLQVGIQVGLRGDLCRFHRLAEGFSGFAEGWALYAEALMSELGLYERPEHELGRLANEMARACRVVFDIGAHLDLPIPADAPFRPGQRWTFEAGVELMESFAGMSPALARDEVTRYLGWPGQAVSYKVGQRAFLELRTLALSRPGMDLRTFHARVLGCGNVGLDRLREQVLGD